MVNHFIGAIEPMQRNPAPRTGLVLTNNELCMQRTARFDAL